MKALIINDSGEDVPESFLTEWVPRVAKALQTRGVLPETAMSKELSLVFLREVDAKNLNWNFRQKDYATDILSFQTEDPESFGELVMCPFVLKRQAKANKHSDEFEMGYMVLHGILHLLGYDHEKDEKTAHQMFGLQDGVFEELTRPPKKEKAPKKAVQVAKAKPVKAAKPLKHEKPVKAGKTEKPAKKAVTKAVAKPVAKKPTAKKAAKAVTKAVSKVALKKAAAAKGARA